MNGTPVLVSIVTHNDEKFLPGCLASVLEQTRSCRIRVLDNASNDASVEVASQFTSDVSTSVKNVGFSAGHNQNLSDQEWEFALLLNPDTILTPTFVERLAQVLEEEPNSGLAGGKLFKMDEESNPVKRSGRAVLDSTGIEMSPWLRHFDRGSGKVDGDRYHRRQQVFGVSGAALFFRRNLYEDLKFEGEFLDADFFAYREDVDLAWRARLRGWEAIYEPGAKAWHARRVTPKNRRSLPSSINYHSLKNRYLLYLKNLDWPVLLRCLPWMLVRDFGILLYALTLERSSLKAYSHVWRLRDRTLAKRRWIQTNKKANVARWFSFQSQEIDL